MRHSSIVVRSLPFALYIAFLALGPVLAGALPESVDPRHLYAVRVGVVTVALGLLWRQYEELKGATPSARQALLAVAVGTGVFVLWINLDAAPLVIGTSEGFDPRVGTEVRWALAVPRLAGAALVVPVMEELFWRSFVLRWLERQTFLDVDPGSIGWRALVISSAIFAVEHHLWLAGLLAGLAYGWLYMRTGSLWAAILAHAVTNGLLGVWVLTTGAWELW